MNKHRLIRSLFALLSVFVLAVTITYAWIAYSESLGSGTISVGEIEYTYNGAFINGSETIFPNKELLDSPITVDNQSTIDTQLRLTISYTLIDDLSTTTKVYKDEASDDLAVVFDDVFLLDGDYWYYQATDYSITSTGLINLISSVYYDGNAASNEYASQNVEISILMQVKQADNVTWIDLATYDFNTGNPS